VFCAIRPTKSYNWLSKKKNTTRPRGGGNRRTTPSVTAAAGGYPAVPKALEDNSGKIRTFSLIINFIERWRKT
jgi:hypothetical protein